MYQRAVSDRSAVACLVVEQGVALVPQRLVGVHARAVVAEEGLGHEGRGLALSALAVFLTMYWNFMEVVGRVHHRVEAGS